MRVLIKGAGDLASGIAKRLYACGMQVLMTEIAVPTTVRRTVAYSRAVYEGSAEVEGLCAVCAPDAQTAVQWAAQGKLVVLVDPSAAVRTAYAPDVVVDAILAKRNLGTALSDAPRVIGVGPGFTAGKDCHAVVETQRGHDLGRVRWRGSAKANTGVPGNIGGYTTQRLIRAGADGRFIPRAAIGDQVRAGQVVAHVEGTPVYAQIDGVLRGLLQDGVPVHAGMKAGDVDPRGCVEHCFTISDKARAIGGGVLEAALAVRR